MKTVLRLDDPRTDRAPYSTVTSQRREDEFDADNLMAKAQTQLLAAADVHRRAGRHDAAHRCDAMAADLAGKSAATPTKRADRKDHAPHRSPPVTPHRSPYADAWRSTPAQIRADALPDKVTPANAWQQPLPSRRAR